MARARKDVAALESRLGHSFSDPDLLTRALTHVSVGGGPGSYQRLEFLGDRVLGLAVADMLVAAFPKATEGELSKRLAELVRRETCAAVALSWDVGPFLHLGAGEAQAGGRRNPTILADVCESVLGAVFLDAGYDAARALVERAFAERLSAQAGTPRDPKTALQEWAQGRGLATPTYGLVERTGPDHAPVFRVAARIPDLPEAVGSGQTKRAAEQDAARGFLIREGVWSEADG